MSDCSCYDILYIFCFSGISSYIQAGSNLALVLSDISQVCEQAINNILETSLFEFFYLGLI